MAVVQKQITTNKDLEKIQSNFTNAITRINNSNTSNTNSISTLSNDIGTINGSVATISDDVTDISNDVTNISNIVAALGPIAFGVHVDSLSFTGSSITINHGLGRRAIGVILVRSTNQSTMAVSILNDTQVVITPSALGSGAVWIY